MEWQWLKNAKSMLKASFPGPISLVTTDLNSDFRCLSRLLDFEVTEPTLSDAVAFRFVSVCSEAGE